MAHPAAQGQLGFASYRRKELFNAEQVGPLAFAGMGGARVPPQQALAAAHCRELFSAGHVRGHAVAPAAAVLPPLLLHGFRVFSSAALWRCSNPAASVPFPMTTLSSLSAGGGAARRV